MAVVTNVCVNISDDAVRSAKPEWQIAKQANKKIMSNPGLVSSVLVWFGQIYVCQFVKMSCKYHFVEKTSQYKM